MKTLLSIIALAAIIYFFSGYFSSPKPEKNDSATKHVKENVFDKKMSMKTIDSLTASYNYSFSHENLNEDLGRPEALSPEQVYAAVIQNEGKLK